MKNNILPLRELSIAQIYDGDEATYEVPIYQRNYAWEKDEISVLIQDIYDAYKVNKDQIYFIGTLVTFHKGDQVYEVIDGQQRLTTINLILYALGRIPKNKLTYRARKKSNDTIKSIPHFENEEKDYGIINGFKYAEDAINEIVPKNCQKEFEEFKDYFSKNVHLVHYQVPKDIDLNHYFEIMNSRGEQLEKHEIIKARLIRKLNDLDQEKFNRIWEFCSEMNVYIQQKFHNTEIFGDYLCEFKVLDFDRLPDKADKADKIDRQTIGKLIHYESGERKPDKEDKADTFQSIIDFPNLLLIVLKLTRLLKESNFVPTNFNLDDKELINEFDKVETDEEFVKRFGYNLLKTKFLLDNYLVHHSNEDDTIENNPWKLQYWQKDEKGYLKNRDGESDMQHKLVQLLSMFEVSFTAKQRKNYLFYSLLYLFDLKEIDISEYFKFLSSLANKYFRDVYLVEKRLNQINTPKPGSFDETILFKNKLSINPNPQKIDTETNTDFNTIFNTIYGDGITESKGIPLFVFNYLDYKLWEKYADELRGKNIKEGDEKRTDFFTSLGCSDFGLKVFEQFYFSRTRRSLEHYFPQANAGKDGAPTQAQVNCLGNYAMIGSEVNSSGSNWSPKTKLDHYLDASGKIKQISVASIKFMIMMQKCKDNQNTDRVGQEWNFDEIKAHQEKMLKVLL